MIVAVDAPQTLPGVRVVTLTTWPLRRAIASLTRRLALDITLPVTIEHRLERGIAVGDHKTSMLQDLEAGKPLESDCLTEAVIELADQLDLAVPHTRTLHACVKLLDAQLRPSASAPAPPADDGLIRRGVARG